MSSPSMLEQAIVDANSLREAALKNAQSRVLEQYSSQVKEALAQLLEADAGDAPPEDPSAAGPDVGMGGADLLGMGGDMGQDSPGLTDQAPLGVQAGTNTCPCAEKDKIVTIKLDDITPKPAGESAEMSPPALLEGEDKTMSLDLDLIEEALFQNDEQRKRSNIFGFSEWDKERGGEPPPKPQDRPRQVPPVQHTQEDDPWRDDDRDLLKDLSLEEELAGLFEEGELEEVETRKGGLFGKEDERFNPIEKAEAWQKYQELLQKHPDRDRKFLWLVALNHARTSKTGKPLSPMSGIAKSHIANNPPTNRRELAMLEAIDDVVAESLTVDVDEVRSGWTATPHPDLHDVALAQSMDDKYQDRIKAMEKSAKQLQNENQKLKADVQRLSDGLKKSITALTEANVINARLLYGNKVLANESLNTKQKKEHVAALTKANSIEEAKLIFETLQNAADSTTSNRKEPKSLREAVQYNTPSTLSLMREKVNENRDQASPEFARMQVLAGIKK